MSNQGRSVDSLIAEVEALNDKLRRQRELHDRIYDGSPVMMFRANEEGVILSTNRAMTAALHTRADEIVGYLCGQAIKCVNSLVGDGCGCNRPCESCVVRSSVVHTCETGDAVYRREGQITVDLGQGVATRQVLVTTALIEDDGGKDVLVSVDDVTERKVVEEELGRYRDSLEEQVVERTRALTAANSAREQALERIEHLNRVLVAIREINGLIVSERDPERLIQRACDLLVANRGYRGAWIATQDATGRPEIWAQANWGRGFDAMAAAFDKGWWPACRDQVAGDALSVISTEERCQGCPLWEHYGHDFAVVVGLHHSGASLGILGVALPGSQSIGEDEKALLEEVAGDLGMALATITAAAERRQAQEALERERKLLRDIAHNYPNSFVSIIDRDMRVVFTSGQEFSNLGLDPDEFVGRAIDDIFAEDAAVVRGHYEQTFAGEETVFELETAGRHHLYRTVPLHEADGTVARILSVVENISERRRAEEALHRKELVFARSIAANSIAGTDGIITEANPQFVELWGYDGLDEVIGKPIAHFLHSDDDAAMVVAALAERGRWLGDYVAVRKDGSTFTAMGLATDLRDATGELIGYQSSVLDVTEARNSQRELVATEDRLRAEKQFTDTALDAQLDTFFVFDPAAQRAVRWNRAFEEVSGYSAEEIATMPAPQSYFRAAELQRAERFLAQVLRDGAGTIDLELMSKDGRATATEYQASVVDVDGARYVIAVGRDMSKRKRAEEALRKSEASYRALAENIPGLVYRVLCREGGRMVFFNDAITALTGYRVDELEAGAVCSIESFMLDEDRPAVVASVERAIAARDTFAVEYRLRHKDGSTRYLSETGRPVFDDDGLLSLDGIILDVTDHRLAEAALRESEERLQTAFDSSPDFLMLLDREHRIQMINRVVIAGDRREVVGLAVYELAAPRDRERIKAHLDRVIDEAVTQSYDTELTRPEGTTMSFSSVAAPIVVAGEVVGSVLSSRDVSERQRLARERDELEEQFRQSQKMEAVGRLAGGIAHDFNNLLTVINSYAGFAAEQLRDGDPLRADVEQILDSGKRAATLTGQLLALSRRQVMEPRVLDLNVVVGDMERILRRVIGEDLEFETRLAADLGRVEADPGQLEQVLMNLAVNARDAMPDGGKLTIETANVEVDEEFAHTHPDTPPGSYVMIDVTDTGYGMAEEVRQRVFEPFFTTKEKGQGTGLGLATVYGIIKQSDGAIWVDSEPDGGTTFKVYLPRVIDEVGVVAREASVAELRGSETVLIVEDETAVRNLVRRVLGGAGYNVISAANGGEALLECERHDDIDLVLTDVVMPQMSGKELTDRLAVVSPGLRVLYMSGYTDDAIVHHGVLDQDVELISKPFTSRDLLARVRSVLDDDQPEAPL